MPEPFPALPREAPATSVVPAPFVAPAAGPRVDFPPGNVAAATKKRGRGHISTEPVEPGPVVVSNVDWAQIRIPDRGEKASYQSGPVFWKFRSDRDCWRVMYRPRTDHEVDLGNIGKRELARLDGMPDQERETAFREFLNRRLTEKGASEGAGRN